MRKTRLFKVLMMFVLLSTASAAAATSAQAWTTNAAAGGSPFTATAPAMLLRISPIGAPTIGLNCTGPNGATGTLLALNNATGTPKQLVSNLRLTFATCTVAGWPMLAACNSTGTLWGSIFTAATQVTSGELRNVSCTITVSPFPGCSIALAGNGPLARAVFGDYDNDTDQVTVQAAGQTLQATWTNACAFLPAGGGPAPATVTNKALGSLVYTVTSVFKPNVTNP